MTPLSKTEKAMLEVWEYKIEQNFEKEARVKWKLEAFCKFKTIPRTMGNGSYLLSAKSNKLRLRLYESEFKCRISDK